MTGLRNINSQISASFTQDGKYIISASEDSQVILWRREEHRASSTNKTRVFVSRYECFPCKEVSVAIPWNGTVRGEPPPTSGSSKKQATKEENSTSKKLPPLPKKNEKEKEKTEKGSTASDPSPQENSPEEEPAKVANPEAGADEPSSNSPSAKTGESPVSLSTSASVKHEDSPAAGADGGGGNSSSSTNSNSNQFTAWGMVIVTGGLNGEIRAFQNFGVPRRFGRQTTLF